MIEYVYTCTCLNYIHIICVSYEIIIYFYSIQINNINICLMTDNFYIYIHMRRHVDIRIYIY